MLWNVECFVEVVHWTSTRSLADVLRSLKCSCIQHILSYRECLRLKKSRTFPIWRIYPCKYFGIYLGLFLTPFQTLLPFCVIFQSMLRIEAFQRISRSFNDAVDISGKDFHFKTVPLPLYFFSWDDCLAAHTHTHTPAEVGTPWHSVSTSARSTFAVDARAGVCCGETQRICSTLLPSCLPPTFCCGEKSNFLSQSVWSSAKPLWSIEWQMSAPDGRVAVPGAVDGPCQDDSMALCKGSSVLPPHQPTNTIRSFSRWLFISDARSDGGRN